LKDLRVEELFCPRLVGSDGEGKTASFIINFMKEAGYEVREEDFNIYLTPWSLLKIGTLIGLIFLLLSWLIYKTHPFISACLSLSLVGGMIFSDRVWYAVAKKKTKSFPAFLKPAQSKNIIAKLKNKVVDKDVPELFLIAHYDSKSQNLSLPIRIIFSILMILNCILLSNQYIAYAANSRHPAYIINFYFLLATISFIFFLFLKTENKSPGALDNGGSLGVLLKLAEEIKEDISKNISITFLFTGAEELGLLGAFAYLNSHYKEINKKKSFFLNLDGIGITGKLRIVGGSSILSPTHGKKLYSSIKKTSQQLGIKISPFIILPGFMMDHIPFVNQGLDSVSLCCIAKKSRMIHTEKDTVELIEEKGLEEVSNLIKSLIKNLDQEASLNVKGL